jgi:hypothetical protein
MTWGLAIAIMDSGSFASPGIVGRRQEQAVVAPLKRFMNRADKGRPYVIVNLKSTHRHHAAESTLTVTMGANRSLQHRTSARVELVGVGWWELPFRYLLL